MPKDHNLNVNYDVFNCNEGVPPEPGLSWNMMTGTWEWDSLKLAQIQFLINFHRKSKMHWKITSVLSVVKRTALILLKTRIIKSLQMLLKKGIRL